MERKDYRVWFGGGIVVPYEKRFFGTLDEVKAIAIDHAKYEMERWGRGIRLIFDEILHTFVFFEIKKRVAVFSVVETGAFERPLTSI